MSAIRIAALAPLGFAGSPPGHDAVEGHEGPVRASAVDYEASPATATSGAARPGTGFVSCAWRDERVRRGARYARKRSDELRGDRLAGPCRPRDASIRGVLLRRPAGRRTGGHERERCSGRASRANLTVSSTRVPLVGALDAATEASDARRLSLSPRRAGSSAGESMERFHPLRHVHGTINGLTHLT